MLLIAALIGICMFADLEGNRLKTTVEYLSGRLTDEKLASRDISARVIPLSHNYIGFAGRDIQ